MLVAYPVGEFIFRITGPPSRESILALINREILIISASQYSMMIRLVTMDPSITRRVGYNGGLGSVSSFERGQ